MFIIEIIVFLGDLNRQLNRKRNANSIPFFCQYIKKNGWPSSLKTHTELTNKQTYSKAHMIGHVSFCDVWTNYVIHSVGKYRKLYQCQVFRGRSITCPATTSSPALVRRKRMTITLSRTFHQGEYTMVTFYLSCYGIHTIIVWTNHTKTCQLLSGIWSSTRTHTHWLKLYKKNMKDRTTYSNLLTAASSLPFFLQDYFFTVLQWASQSLTWTL